MTVRHGAQAVEHLEHGLVEFGLPRVPVQDSVVHGLEGGMKTHGRHYICADGIKRTVLNSEKELRTSGIYARFAERPPSRCGVGFPG